VTESPFDVVRWARDAVQLHELARGPAHALVLLATYCDAEGECWPGLRVLSLAAGVGPKSLERNLAELERRGLIVTRRRRNRSALRYLAVPWSPHLDQGGTMVSHPNQDGTPSSPPEGGGRPLQPGTCPERRDDVQAAGWDASAPQDGTPAPRDGTFTSGGMGRSRPVPREDPRELPEELPIERPSPDRFAARRDHRQAVAA
jgi:hypothetical protein